MTLQEKLEKAINAALRAEELQQSVSTQNRRWRQVFALQDEVKASGNARL